MSGRAVSVCSRGRRGAGAGWPAAAAALASRSASHFSIRCNGLSPSSRGSALMGSWSRSRPPGASASVSVITGPSGVRGCRRIPRRRRPSPATAGEASAARRSSCTAATRTRQSHGTPGRRRHARRHRCTLHLSDPAGTWAFSLLRVRRRMMRQPARQTPRAFGELRPELQHVGHRSARCDRL